MNWIYLSPHLDDVAYSCGGLVWSQTSAGDAASVWTVCAGDPPDTDLSPHAAAIHARWDLGEDVIAKRRLEDIEACRIMGASQRLFDIPDAIYRAGIRSDSDPDGIEREYYYQERDALFGPLNPGEKSLVRSFYRVLRVEIERELVGDNTRIICPLALGNHVDHQLTRQAAELLDIPLLYYADFPYAVDCLRELDDLRISGWYTISSEISHDALEAWVAAVAEYKSQVSTFWSDLNEMRSSVESYLIAVSGGVLWRPPG